MKEIIRNLFLLYIVFSAKTGYTQNIIQEWIAIPAPQNAAILRTSENQLLVDDSGNVYIGGNFNDTITTENIWGIAKMNSSGINQWYATEDGIGYSFGNVTAISLDTNYNLFVTGTTDFNTTFEAGRTNKYDLNGSLVWSHPLDSPATYGTIGHGNYISSQNECYDLIRNQNITIRKFDTSGNVILQFSNDTVDATQNHGFVANHFKRDAENNIYVSGTYADLPNQMDTKYFVKKFSSTGNFKWESFYNPSGGIDDPRDIFIDSLQNVYVTGRYNSPNPGFYATVVYDSSGSQKWQDLFQVNGAGYADDITADKAGNCYVNGVAPGLSNYKCVLLKYDTAGNIIWQRSLDSARASSYAKVKLDDAANVYVTYTGSNSIIPANFVVTAKFDSSGNLKWKIRYNAPSAV
ncbi:MAG: hypothetical protein ABIT08_02215, partial [Bacteroidia bacterium]